MDNKKPSLNFRHSISITHHSSLITHILSLITHHSNSHIRLPSSSNSYHSIFFTLFMDPTTVTVSASSVLLPACHFSHQYFFFLISPSPSALSLSQSRNPNPGNCLNLPSQISTIITDEQRRGLRRVQWRDLAVVTHISQRRRGGNPNPKAPPSRPISQRR